MSGKLRVFISAILLTPAAALGLGLGEIRLNSSLNEPLSAEIDLVAATPEELATLNAELASTEVFTRYGLDRPAWLSSLEFSVGRGQDGRSVLLVRSRDAISEPFVSFLIDVNWPRGRLLREYTVLLDPPAMLAPGDSPAAAPIAAATTAQQPAAAAPAPALAAAPAPATPPAQETAPAAPPTTGQSSYEVARGDTLYGIAAGISGGGRPEIQRTMIALFRANPEAFNGNINRVARRGDPARAGRRRDRRGVHGRGGQRSEPAEHGLARGRWRPGDRPAEARDAAGRGDRACRGGRAERTGRVADRIPRERNFRTATPARTPEPGTRRAAKKACRGARGGVAASRSPLRHRRSPSLPRRSTSRPWHRKTTWRSRPHRRQRLRNRSRRPRPTPGRRSSRG